jgi:DNA replication protein DnaC
MTTAHATTVLPSIPPHLVPVLKALRLGGLQETLPLRLDQAQQQHLGYTEFLELLLGDEIQRRANRALASRLSQAHFEDGDKTFENFDWTFNPQLPQAHLRDLAAGGYLMRKEHIVLCGPVGVGKTHLAEAFGHSAGGSAGSSPPVHQDQPPAE